MNKTILAMLLSSLTTSAWWAAAAMWPRHPGLIPTAIILTAPTFAAVVWETFEILDHKPLTSLRHIHRAWKWLRGDWWEVISPKDGWQRIYNPYRGTKYMTSERLAIARCRELNKL